MALNTKIRGLQINDSLFGAALARNGSDANIMDVQVDNSSIEISGDALQVKAAGITNDMLAGSITYAKLSLSDGDIPETKLAIAQGNLIVGDASGYGSELDLSAAQIVVGDASGYAAAVSVTGDVTISNAGVTAIGATKVTDSMLNDDVASGLAGAGLSASAGVMALDLDELSAVAVDVSADSIAIIDATDGSSKKESIADLVTAMAGSGLTATNGVLSADAITDNIVETDIQKEDESANCNGVTTQFSLSNTPISNSVQVFLNGMLQQEGSGKDYTLTGTNVDFVTAPVTGDLLIIYYIINN